MNTCSTAKKKEKKKKPAKSDLFAIADTMALSFALQNKPNALEDKLRFISLHLPPLFYAESSLEKVSLHSKDMVSTKW